MGHRGKKTEWNARKKPLDQSIDDAVQELAASYQISDLKSFKTGMETYPSEKIFRENSRPITIIDFYIGWAHTKSQSNGTKLVPTDFAAGYYEGFAGNETRFSSQSYLAGYALGRRHYHGECTNPKA